MGGQINIRTIESGDDGAQGAQGPQGPGGAQGPAGPAGDVSPDTVQFSYNSSTAADTNPGQGKFSNGSLSWTSPLGIGIYI